MENYVEKERTFESLINNIINKFDRYRTIKDLHTIIEDIDNLDAMEKINHPDHIIAIKNVILLLSRYQYDYLTENQKSAMLLALKTKVTTAKLDRCYVQKLDDGDFKYSEKFECDDEIHQIVFSLLSILSCDTYGSSLNQPIYDQFELLENLVNNDPEKYSYIMKDIRNCFKNNGWIAKTELTLGGFKTAPNRVKLAEELQDIYNEFF